MRSLSGQHFPRLILLANNSEAMFEDPAFQHRELAALVASKVYYHLGAYKEALHLALGAGQHFDVEAKSEYVENIICNSFLSVALTHHRSALTDR